MSRVKRNCDFICSHNLHFIQHVYFPSVCIHALTQAITCTHVLAQCINSVEAAMYTSIEAIVLYVMNTFMINLH